MRLLHIGSSHIVVITPLTAALALGTDEPSQRRENHSASGSFAAVRGTGRPSTTGPGGTAALGCSLPSPMKSSRRQQRRLTSRNLGPRSGEQIRWTGLKGSVTALVKGCRTTFNRERQTEGFAWPRAVECNQRYGSVRLTAESRHASRIAERASPQDREAGRQAPQAYRRAGHHERTVGCQCARRRWVVVRSRRRGSR